MSLRPKERVSEAGTTAALPRNASIQNNSKIEEVVQASPVSNTKTPSTKKTRIQALQDIKAIDDHERSLTINDTSNLIIGAGKALSPPVHANIGKSPVPGSLQDLENYKISQNEKKEKPGKLEVTSTVKEFVEFSESIDHPSIILKLSEKIDDKAVFSFFDTLCNEVLTTLADVEASFEDLCLWKNDF